MSQQAQVLAAFEQIGSLDILVNNADVAHVGTVETTAEADFEIETPPDLMPFLGELAHPVTRRVVARVRASGHGGMLAYVPTASVPRCVGPAATLRPKDPVQLPGEAHYYNGLQLAIVAFLAELGDTSWSRYRQAGDARLVALETAVGQYAHLLADLMTVDGALVVTKQLAIVGFGIEVYAPNLASLLF